MFEPSDPYDIIAVYHAAVCHMRDRGISIPTVLEVADEYGAEYLGERNIPTVRKGIHLAGGV